MKSAPASVDERWTPPVMLWTPTGNPAFSMDATVASGCHGVGYALGIWHPWSWSTGAANGTETGTERAGQAWATTRTVSSKTTPPTSSTGTV